MSIQFHTLTLALVSAGLVAVSNGASASMLQEETSITPGRTITPADETILSDAAIKVLGHMKDARDDLEALKPDTASAKKELVQADKLLAVMMAAMPTERIRHHIWTTDKNVQTEDYVDEREVSRDVVPLNTSVDELVSYDTPAKTANASTGKGQDTAQAEEADTGALSVTETAVPLHALRHRIWAARSALDKADAKTALSVLNGVSDDLMTLSVAMDDPISVARVALERSAFNLDAGSPAMARADLSEAANALAQASQQGDDISRAEAAKLLTDVRAMDASLAQDNATDPGKMTSQSQAQIQPRMQGMVQRMEALSHRAIDQVANGWRQQRDPWPGRDELIDAKLYLAFAGMDYFHADDKAAAQVDLAQAKGYLDAAANKAAPDFKGDIQAAGQLIGDLSLQLKDDVKLVDPYSFNQALRQVDRLVEQL